MRVQIARLKRALVQRAFGCQEIHTHTHTYRYICTYIHTYYGLFGLKMLFVITAPSPPTCPAKHFESRICSNMPAVVPALCTAKTDVCSRYSTMTTATWYLTWSVIRIKFIPTLSRGQTDYRVSILASFLQVFNMNFITGQNEREETTQNTTVTQSAACASYESNYVTYTTATGVCNGWIIAHRLGATVS